MARKKEDKSTEKAKDWGYVGDVGTAPRFSQEIVDFRETLRELTQSISEVSGKIRNKQNEINNAVIKVEAEKAQLIADRENARLLYGSGSKQYKSLSKKIDRKNDKIDRIKTGEGNDGKLKRELIKLEEDENKLTLQQLQLQAQKRDREREINKELSYQNKKLKEGVTLRERTLHYLDNNVLNTKRFSNGISEIKSGFNSLLGIAKSLLQPWGEINQAAANMAKNVGLGRSQFLKMQGEILNFTTSHHLEARFNMGAKDMIELQEKYALSTGRQIFLNENDAEKAAALSKTLGGIDNATQMTSALENFGIDQTGTASKVEQMVNRANRYGLAFQKYSENFLSNIKMAQNYTFENGLKSLAAMAERSTAIKLNMQQVAHFADNVSSVEGALKTGASLSVLGGSFAQFSDPMRMLYYGLNDIGGLEKNIEGMFGKKAYFNKKTGQIEVSAYNRQMVKAAADATGMNYDQLMESIYAQGRRNRLEPILERQGLTKNQREAVLNRAQLDENGQGYISIGGKKKMLSEGFSQQELNTLENTGDNKRSIEAIAEATMGYKDNLEAIQKSLDDNSALITQITGIGETATKIMAYVATQGAILAQMNFLLKGLQALGSVGGVINGTGNVLTSFGGRNGTPRLSMTPVNGSPIPQPKTATGFYREALNAGMSRADAKEWARINTNGRGANFIQRGAVNAGRFFRGNIVGASMMGGILAGIGGSMLSSNADNHIQRGDFSDSVRNRKVGGTALSYAGMGASLGGMFGPLGALIGGVGGAIAGGLKAHSDFYDQKYRNDIFKNSHGQLRLEGDYSNYDLGLIATKGTNGVQNNDRLKDSIVKQEHFNNWSEVPKFKHGGLIHGKGNGYSDSIIARLSDNEYVMPSYRVHYGYNREILDMMKDGHHLVPKFKHGGLIHGKGNGYSDSILKPSKNPMNIIKFNGVTSQKNPKSFKLDKVQVEPISINGTIKLDFGNSYKDIDVNKLLNNPIFVQQLTNQIMKNVNTQMHMGYDKNSFYKKF